MSCLHISSVGLLRFTFRFIPNPHLLPKVSFYFLTHISPVCSKKVIALGFLLAGSESVLLLNANAVKKGLSKFIYILKKTLLICVRKYSMYIWSSLIAHISCLSLAHICFIHCHYGSFTISVEIRRLMCVELGYLILLSPVGLFVSCQWLSTFIHAPLCLLAHAARNWICQMPVPVG